MQGRYEKAAEIARRSIRLPPDRVAGYENLAAYFIALNRFDEARQVIPKMRARKMDDYNCHDSLYALAFLDRDSTAMAEQLHGFATWPEYEHIGLALASDTEAYRGHLTEARELTRREVASAIRADNKESGAIEQADAALEQAAYGRAIEAQQAAAKALKLACFRESGR